MMVKAVVFNNIYEARIFNSEKSLELFGFNGHATKYKFSMRPLSETTTITKVEYASYNNISETVEDEEGNQIPNPKYSSLEDSYTVPKMAVIVKDSLIVKTYDEETGELVSETEPDYVEEITIPIPKGE